MELIVLGYSEMKIYILNFTGKWPSKQVFFAYNGAVTVVTAVTVEEKVQKSNT